MATTSIKLFVRSLRQASLAIWVLEDGPPLAENYWRSLFSACVTLALAILGSTILTVPYAFSGTGVTVGCLTMALVAFCNVQTCFMLIRAAAYTGLDTYEALAEWAAGTPFKVFTQISLLLLLFGNICGDMALWSDNLNMLLLRGYFQHFPLVLQDQHVLLSAITVLFVLPLCLLRHIRQIEAAATLGFGVVVAVCCLVIYKAIQLDFPAIRNGQLPILFDFKDSGRVFEAFSVIGFAFYMQPTLMPLCKELPRGKNGCAIPEQATCIVVYGVACLTYGIVGIFGAATYGQQTSMNIMANDLLTARVPVLVLFSTLTL